MTAGCCTFMESVHQSLLTLAWSTEVWRMSQIVSEAYTFQHFIP